MRYKEFLNNVITKSGELLSFSVKVGKSGKNLRQTSFNSFGSREFLETREDKQMIKTLLNSLYRTGKTPCEAFSFRISMKQIQNGTNLLNSGINFQF